MLTVSLFFFIISVFIYYITANWLFGKSVGQSKITMIVLLAIALVSGFLANSDKLVMYAPLFVSILLIGFEIVIPGFGIFGVFGILGTILSFLIFKTPLNIEAFLVIASVLLGLMAFIMKFKNEYHGLRSNYEAVKIEESYIGKEAVVVSTLRPVGKVKVDDEIIDATSKYDFITEGEVVIIKSNTTPVKVERKK